MRIAARYEEEFIPIKKRPKITNTIETNAGTAPPYNESNMIGICLRSMMVLPKWILYNMRMLLNIPPRAPNSNL